MNKTYCILEQGSLINEPETIDKKQLFTTEFSDFYRLNWKTGLDPHADFFAPQTVWSEGRSILFQQIPKKYDYYIFIDDDAKFETQSPEGIAKEIKRLLEHFRPLSGTFLNSADRGSWPFKGNLKVEDYEGQEAFLISGFDLCAHVFHQSFAEVMFPVVHHGAGRCMWYAQWVCHTLFPRKQICFTTVTYQNTRGEPHENSEKSQFIPQNKIVKLFNRHVIGDCEIPQETQSIQCLNMSLLRNQDDSTLNKPCLKQIEFKYEHLKSIYDTRNFSFMSRSARARNMAMTNSYRTVYFVHHRLKCVYVLVPKGGSRTILLRLGIELPEIKERAISEGISLEPKHRIVSSGGIEIKGICIETGDLVWERKKDLAPIELDYFLFSFVRDPAERIASAYRDFFLKRQEPERLAGEFRGGGSLDMVVAHVCSTSDRNLNPHLRSQIASLGIGRTHPIDFIGKLEDFEEDWAIVEERIGVKCENSGESLNVTSKRSEPSMLNLKNRQDLQVRYAEDFRILGYKEK